MTLRRVPAGLPLVALAGLAVHVAAAGFGHVPGLDRGPALFALLATGLGLAALTAFLGAALRPRRRSIATKASDAASVAALAAGGFGAYAALELLEGHGFAGARAALAACLPVAVLVRAAGAVLGSLLSAAGAALAAFAARSRPSGAGAFAPPGPNRRRNPDLNARRARLGRAPPQFA